MDFVVELPTGKARDMHASRNASDGDAFMCNSVPVKARIDPLEHVCGQRQKWRMSATEGECGRALERKKRKRALHPLVASVDK